jgi:hypothetical protein
MNRDFTFNSAPDVGSMFLEIDQGYGKDNETLVLGKES